MTGRRVHLSPEQVSLPRDVPLVVLKRAGVVESVHRGRYAFCDPTGRVTGSAGDVDALFYPRSAIKPFQAMPLLLSGAADAYGFTDEELAVACGSHHGEERHVAVVGSLLEKAGLTEEVLDNGAHPPLSQKAANDLVSSGQSPRRIHGNCSGKHAGMISVCKHMGWEIEGYRSPSHPLQTWIRSLISNVCGVPEEQIGVGTDGCGAPAFSFTLEGLATGFARLSTGRNLSDELATAALRLSGAMRANPFMVSGSEGFDTAVMETAPVVVKGGADGVLAVGSAEGWGFAIKVSDGAARAVRVASAAAVRRYGVDLHSVVKSEVLNLHGEYAGELVPLEAEQDERP